jgi:6-phosphogluconolactonase
MTIESADIKYTIFKTKEALFFFLANELQRYSELEVTQHISLSGGSTPKGLFSYITSTQFKNSIQWHNLHFWWGDERCVEFKELQSNYGEARRLLFDHIEIPKRNIHFIPLDLVNTIEDYQIVSESYSSKMKQEMPIINEYPVYDWILLGVGEDGHTASLFPNETDLDTSDITLCVLKPITNEFRISLSANAIRSAKRITYLATGRSKARVISDILKQEGGYHDYPAYLIQSEQGITEYLLDSDASNLLD